MTQWRLPDEGECVVQARFTPAGKVYHYICGAKIGATIQVPTVPRLATVVGYGWAAGTKPQPLREARSVCAPTKTIVEKEFYTMGVDHAPPHGTITDVDKLTQQLKAAKKAAKKARKAERERKAAATEKARLYAVGIAALESRAERGNLDAITELIAESRR
jgi:hypothetical protein